MSYIGLLDCNNFFVSCERLFRPDLLGKPVVVLSGNDGCVVARSNEVKELGIPMGVPYFKVKDELKAAKTTVFSSNFTLYRDISRRVMAVLKEEVSLIEQYSVDEAFFKVEDDRVLDRLQAIKHAVETKIGVPVSVGAGQSKTIAKFAAEKEKRGKGICFLVGDSWQQETINIPLQEVWGIGRQTSQKMSDHGLTTVAELLAADSARVAKLFGIAGVRKCAELRGQMIYRLGDGTEEEQQSITSTRSFGSTTTDPLVVEEALLYHVSQVAKELREKGLTAGHLSVMAKPSRHSDWTLRGGSAEAILDTPSNDTRILIKEAKRLWRTFYETGVPYKKAGVGVGFLRPVSVQQGGLWGEIDRIKDTESVLTVMDDLNKKFGKQALTIGAQHHSGSWSSLQQKLSPYYTTKWSEIALVRTN